MARDAQACVRTERSKRGIALSLVRRAGVALGWLRHSQTGRSDLRTGAVAPPSDASASRRAPRRCLAHACDARSFDDVTLNRDLSIDRENNKNIRMYKRFTQVHRATSTRRREGSTVSSTGRRARLRQHIRLCIRLTTHGRCQRGPHRTDHWMVLVPLSQSPTSSRMHRLRIHLLRGLPRARRLRASNHVVVTRMVTATSVHHAAPAARTWVSISMRAPGALSMPQWAVRSMSATPMATTLLGEDRFTVSGSRHRAGKRFACSMYGRMADSRPALWSNQEPISGSRKVSRGSILASAIMCMVRSRNKAPVGAECSTSGRWSTRMEPAEPS
jgi:hypothetical protein